MATATATVTTTSTSSTTSYPLIETVYDDDDSSYEEYVIEEIIEEEIVLDDMAEDEKKADASDLNVNTMTQLKPPPPVPREKGVDDSTVSPPPPPSTRSGSTPSPSTDTTSTAPPSAKTPSIVSPPLTPSKERAKAASSAGLSELSKQLRVLHAKNESQAQDISRLERQLRILADLQGISVADLRKALEEACASEAFGELQNRVQKLKFELEAATIAKQAEYQRKDTAAPHIANLELRVGELEEVEERQSKEIHHLYEQLRQERAKSTRLELENTQLKKELEDLMKRYKQEHERASQLESTFQDQIRKFQEDQMKKMQEQLQLARQRLEQQQHQQQSHETASKSPTDRSSSALAVSSSGTSPAVLGSVSPEMAVEYDRMVQALRQKDDELRISQSRLNAEEVKWVQKLREVQEQAQKAQMDLQVEYDKLALTVKELEDADGQNGLRLAQYKARFAVQDERIDDLEQQLDSLYTAFTLLKEEFDTENRNRAEMLNNLNDADAEIARQANVLEKQKSQRGGLGVGATPVSSNAFPRDDRSASSVPRLISTPVTHVTTPSRSTDLDTTSYGGQVETYTSTPSSTYASAQPYTPSTPERTSSTWQLLFPEEAAVGTGGRGSWLIHGPLIVESKGMLRKWKTKPSKIYLRGDHYQWEIGSKQSWPLQFGISKVEFNPNYSLSFVVYLNPNDTMAPIIRAATSSERDYHRWMAALTKVTTGEEYSAASDSVSATPGTPRSSRRSLIGVSPSSSRMTRPAVGNNTTSHGGSFRSSQLAPNMDYQEAIDLERALELSKQQM